MSGRVDLRVEDGVAIASITNAPVNALSTEIRRGLMAALEKTRTDPAIQGVILTSEGKIFSGGVDITEFDRPPEAPILADVIAAVSTLGKPVVVAIQGLALGGAVELALACSARIVSPDARLGLPEIKLGLIPGAGGAQRLPRAIGAAPAFDMMLKGDPVSASRALELGLIEGIADGDLIAAAKTQALELSSRPAFATGAGKLARDGERAEFEKAAARAAKENPGKPNVIALIEAVRTAFDKPLPEGLAFDRQLFLKLRDDDRSKALRYAFFAERKAGKVKAFPPETMTRPVARAAVIGAGVMGTGIAICFLNAGIPVTVIEDDQDALSRGLDRIGATLEDGVRRGKSCPEARDKQLALLNASLNLG